MPTLQQYAIQWRAWLLQMLQPGQTTQTGVRRHSRAFLYQTDDPKGLLKTPEGIKEDRIRAATHQPQGVNRSIIVNGVKGSLWLSTLHYFDLVEWQLTICMKSLLAYRNYF